MNAVLDRTLTQGDKHLIINDGVPKKVQIIP